MGARFKRITGAAIAVILGGLGTAQADGSPEVYGAIPDVSEVQISPDGATIAMLRTVDGTTSVVFYDLDNSEQMPFGVSLKSGEARDLVWADNDHVLMLASDLGRMSTVNGLEDIEFFRWFSVSKSKAKPVVLFGNEGNLYMSSSGVLLSTLPNAEGEALISRYSVYGGSYDVFRVDLDSSRTKRDEGGGQNTVGWIASMDGDIIGRVDYLESQERRILLTRAGEGDPYRKVFEVPEGRGDEEAVWFFGESPGRTGLLAYARNSAGLRSAVEISRETGEKTKTIYENPKYDIEDAVFDYAKATAVGAIYVDDMPRTVFFDPADQNTQQALEKAMPNATPMVVSWSNDKSRMIVKAIYSHHPPQYFLYDKAAKSLSMVAASYAALDGKPVAHKEKFDYVTEDGLTIHGYLTVPDGASKKKMPLIVLPHGGPQGRDDMAFDWWSFFYAANGYLVYQPNFRGSDGYGWDFVEASFGEWGRKMQDDLTNGVVKLIKDGIVDRDRICIVGGSYGGYAALAGATLTPDLYACAVSVNGVSDLAMMIGRRARWSRAAQDYWDIRVGSRFRDEKELQQVSPAKIAYRAGAPIMIIHGKDDTVVPFSHALNMREALEVAGKPVEFVELDGEDHWLSRTETRTQMLAKSIGFIRKNIGPGGEEEAD